jgi:hypothetical protein
MAIIIAIEYMHESKISYISYSIGDYFIFPYSLDANPSRRCGDTEEWHENSSPRDEERT